MNKAYSRINFQNAPSTATPLNATNLNKMDKAINDLDDRIIELSGYQEEAQEAAEQASSSASAAAKAAETATADAEARVNEIIAGMEVYTKEESDKKFASVIKQVATGSPILIKDSSDAGVIDFKGKGRSTQNGTPTPDSPIAIKSVADSGYFDGELLQGYYSSSIGDFNSAFVSSVAYVCNKNIIPCQQGDKVMVLYGENALELGVFFWDKDYKFISKEHLTPANQLTATAPANTSYLTFWVNKSGITPQTAKKITVTINGKYVLIVKSKGKNLLNLNDNSQNASGFTYNSFTNELVEGVAKVSGDMFICSYSAYFEKGKTYIFSFDNTINFQQAYIYSDKLWGNLLSSLQVTSYPYYTHNVDSGVFVIGWYGRAVSGTTYRVSKPMLRLAEITDDTYEPYKEEVKYIPLNEPLRSSLDGSVTDEVSLTECKRKFGKFVLNGTENWYFTANTNMYMSLGGLLKPNGIVISDYYVVNKTKAENTILVNGANVIIYDKRFATVDEWKAHLRANPVTLIYELAEPITETIEPVDIVTYNNVTYLTASDDAEMEVTYATDTKSYIDSKFAELHAAIVNML